MQLDWRESLSKADKWRECFLLRAVPTGFPCRQPDPGQEIYLFISSTIRVLSYGYHITSECVQIVVLGDTHEGFYLKGLGEINNNAFLEDGGS